MRPLCRSRVTLHGLLDGAEDRATVVVEHFDAYAIAEAHEVRHGSALLNDFVHALFDDAGEAA